MKYIVLFLCFLQLIGKSSSTFKRWLPDTNFENPDNWNVKRSPCGNDVVIIPDESPVVYMQLNTTIKELVLPISGELILGPNVNVGFTENSSPDCPSAEGDVDFTATYPKSWLNPKNWCMSPSERGACDNSTPQLDVEKIPCAYDDVVMPRYHSYFIDLSEKVPELTVKSLKISGSSFTTSSFFNYLKNQDGRRMFKTASPSSTDTKLTITRKGCDDRRGCACGNDQPGISKTICSHVEKVCHRPKCKNTIQPVGGCCKICGALFNLTRGYGYDFNAFKDLIRNNFFTDEVGKDVNMTLSVMYQGWIQLVLNDKTGVKSVDLAKRIKADMDDDLAHGGHKYAIDSVQLMLSMGSSLAPSAHSGSQLSDGSVAGIAIGVIVILVLLVLVTIFFVFRKTGRDVPKMPSMPSMPSLPRLPRRSPKATARVPAQPHTASHVDPGFANPLYDSSPFDDGNVVVKEMELMSAAQEQPTFDLSSGGGFNNPLYGASQGAMYDDPAKADNSTTKSDDKASTAATGAAKKTADLPTGETSAKMVLVDINDDDSSI